MIDALNGGCFVEAGPGTGKTRAFIPKLMEAWRDLNPNVVFVKVAPTYVAAKQMRGGITCQAAVQSNVHNRFQDQVMIVDEVSMVGTKLLERMARWSIMGLKFVLIGDFSQLLPVGVDGATRYRVEDSRTFMKLAGHLRIVLNQNRRAAGDQLHFERVMMLRPRVDQPIDEIVATFARMYPWNGQRISYYICLSHRKRMRINKWQNDLEKGHHAEKLFIASPGFMKGCASQPQHMWVWKGLQLIGGGRTSRNILNGVMYIVEGYNDEFLQIKVHPDFADGEPIMEVPIREAAENLRLCYAAVYHSCQGRTLDRQHVLLLDANHTYFTGRHLYVGASRVTAGQYLHVASREDQQALYGGVQVPLDEVVEADVEMDEQAVPMDVRHYDPTGGVRGDWTDDEGEDEGVDED
jgi:hypothetical protein